MYDQRQSPDRAASIKSPADTSDKTTMGTGRKNPRTWNWQVLLGLILSAAGILLALRGVELSVVAETLRQVSFWPLVLAEISLILLYVFKAKRWQVLLHRVEEPDFSSAFDIFNIGNLVNNFLFARLGELLRIYLMGEAHRESKMFVLGSIAIEKVIELLVLVISTSLVLTQMALPEWLIEPWQFSLIAVVVSLPLVALFAWKGETVLAVIERLSRYLPFQSIKERISRQAHLGMQSVQLLRKPSILIEVVVWTVLALIFGVLTNFLTFYATGLSPSVWASLLLLVVLQAGGSVPSTAGKIGVFHFLTVLSLSLFDVAKEPALGYAIVLHLLGIGTIAVLGILGLWRQNIGLRKLSKSMTLGSQPSDIQGE